MPPSAQLRSTHSEINNTADKASSSIACACQSPQIGVAGKPPNGQKDKIDVSNPDL
jgi:hypothetical protein